MRVSVEVNLVFLSSLLLMEDLRSQLVGLHPDSRAARAAPEAASNPPST
jgi:hypothetical protein